MKISSVTPQKKHITRVCGTDGSELLLDTDFCAEVCLKEGMTLSAEQVTELKERSDYIRTRSRALWYLDRASHTERGLYEKLCRAGFPEKSAAAVIARFCELDLLNDSRFAEGYAERYAEAGLSKRAISDKLYSKGVPLDIIKQTLSRLSFDEVAQVRAVIEKKYAARLNSGETEKVFAALVRKGFSYGAVRTALKEYAQELEYTEEV